MLLLILVYFAGMVYRCYQMINHENNFFHEYKFHDKT